MTTPIQSRTYEKEATECKNCGIELQGTVHAESGGSQTMGFSPIPACHRCFIVHYDDLPSGPNHAPQPCWPADTPQEVIDAVKDLKDGGEDRHGHKQKKYRREYDENDWDTVRWLVKQGYKFSWHAQHSNKDYLPLIYRTEE